MPVLKPISWRPNLAEDAPFTPPGRPARPAGLLTFFDDDLRPARAVNDWLQELSTSNPLTTCNDYGREVARFSNFSEQYFSTPLLGPDIHKKGNSILKAYAAHLIKADEKDDSDRPVGDSASTLGKRRAALLSFYWWAVEEKLISNLPFKLVTVPSRRGPVQTLAYLRGGRRTVDERQSIPSAQIGRFLQVGVRGQLPTGGPDPDFLSFMTSQRNAAGFALGVAFGLRHAEILGTTIFEIPPAHPDGLTPARVADAISKRERGRNIVGLSEWLGPAHAYMGGDRRRIARKATWVPKNPWEIDPARTTRTHVLVRRASGREESLKWNDLGLDERLQMVIPGHGTPLLLLNHRDENGSPLTDADSLNDAFTLAGTRCQKHWPALNWDFSTHHLRHTFCTELTDFLSESDFRIGEFEALHGRQPAWARLLLRQDKSRIVQESMGHSSIETTNKYRKSAFWKMLLSVAADPEHNPAIRESQA